MNNSQREALRRLAKDRGMMVFDYLMRYGPPEWMAGMYRTAKEAANAFSYAEHMARGSASPITIKGDAEAIARPPQGEANTMNQETIDGLKAKLAQAEADKAAKDAADALYTELSRLMALADATQALLSTIRGSMTHTTAAWALFRDELQPLSERFGYDIVLVGDKTQATLVQR